MNADMWFYEYEGRKVGPIPAETLFHLARRGIIQRQSRLWRGDESAPAFAGTVDGLFESANGSSSSPSEPALIQDSESDLDDGVWLSSDPEPDVATDSSEPYAFPDSDFSDADSAIGSKELSFAWEAVTPELLDDYSRALQLFHLCEAAIEKVMGKFEGDNPSHVSAKVMLEQDLLFLASAMTMSFTHYHGLPIVAVEQVWGTLRGEPDTFCINLSEGDADTDDTLPMGTAHKGEVWSVALDKPCLSVRHLSRHDLEHGSCLNKEFIAFASDFCDLLISHWHLPSSPSEHRKKRLMTWLNDSCMYDNQ